MKKIITLAILLITTSGFAQNVSDYKYIVVPTKFSFLKDANQYNLNTLTKTVLEKQGYEIYFENEILPQDLAENRCKALYANMIESNSLFTTKIKLELKDCKNQVLYVSDEGTSREKEFSKAYVQAFRVVGKSLSILRSKPKQEVVKTNVETVNIMSSHFFAQPITNGFQLVDSSPKVVMRIFKTSLNDYYIAQKENLRGVVFSKNNKWFFEYYQNDILMSEKLEIKF